MKNVQKNEEYFSKQKGSSILDIMTKFDKPIKEFIHQGRFHDLIDFLEKRIPEIPSLQQKVHLEFQLAEAYYSIREFKKSKRLVEKIIPLIQELENQSLLGEAENLLGKIYRLHQRYSEALLHYQNAEKAFKLGNNNDGLSKIYHNCGNVYVFLERFKEAKEYHSKALQLATQEKNPSAIASCHLSIGTMHYQNGEVDDALLHFEKARNLLEEIQELPTLSVVYLNLSETLLLRNNFKLARKYSSKAAKLYAVQKNMLGQQLALTTYARTNKAEGTLEEAIETYRSIIKLNPTGVEEDILLELGECYLAQNQMEMARKSFEKVLKLPTHTLQGAGYSLDYLARIAIDNHEFNEACDIYIRLVNILEQMEPQDLKSIAATHGNLGYMYLKTGNLNRAWEFLYMASDYFKKRKIWDELITLGSNYRNELVAIKDYEHAITVLKDFIIPSVKKSEEKRKENQYHYEVALLFHLKGETQEGLLYWKKNHNKKKTHQKYSPPLLASTFKESTKKELEEQHLKFLKQVLSLNK